MHSNTPQGIRRTASSLTTIATVRRFDRLAPTGFALRGLLQRR
jgi:hypothetical protein